MMKNSLLCVLGFLIINGGQAWAVHWDIPSSDIQDIQLRSKAAKMTAKRSSTPVVRVTVSGSKEGMWNYNVTDKVLKIVGPEESSTVDDSSIELEIPVQIKHSYFVFEEVRADLQGVSQVTLSALRGKVVGRATGDGVQYFMQKGEVQSSQSTGSLEVDSFSGKVTVADNQGSLKLRVFAGEVLVDKNQGALVLDSQASNARVTGQQGIMSLQWGRGNLVVTDLSGRLEGLSEDGQLQIQMNPESMIDLQAGRGRVSVSLPAGSGAQLDVRSVSGDVAVPGPLKAAREGRFKVAKGKLTGALKGLVNVRADDATVVVK